MKRYTKVRNLICKVLFVSAFMLLCNISVKSQIRDLEKWTQKKMEDIAYWLYDRFDDFDRECFLAGTLDYSNGHYQTFTANKSIDDINSKVKWMFEKDLTFIPDTLRCQRITTYGEKNVLALFVVSLFKKDYPDLQAIRVCSVGPFARYYCSEVKSTADHSDTVCTCKPGFDIELLSSALAKTIAGYYIFDYDSISTVSSGGDIGYSGIINKDKITTDAQKLSFLAGFLMRYGWENTDNSKFSINIPNSLSTTQICIDILKEFGCDNIIETKNTRGHFVNLDISDKIRVFISLIQDLFNKTAGVIIAF
jgi:hypothetical protein